MRIFVKYPDLSQPGEFEHHGRTAMRAFPPYLRRLLATAAATFAFACAQAALARPGGGGSYHGGGASHHGGGSFGGGGGFGGGIPVGASSGLGVNGVLFLAMFVIIVLVLVAKQRRAAQGNDDSASPDDDRPLPVDPLAPLRARDPGLTAESVVDHVRQMADKLRAAWCAGDMRPARAFMSDGVFSRFQVQLGLMQGENRRNVMDDSRILQVAIEAVEDAPPLDVVHVRVVGEARDTDVPLGASGDQIRAALARTRVERYTEVWSLSRLSGA
ncbi:MAG: TIM44-like domain-containing protein, partial [Polyangiaceae bacterium]